MWRGSGAGAPRPLRADAALVLRREVCGTAEAPGRTQDPRRRPFKAIGAHVARLRRDRRGGTLRASRAGTLALGECRGAGSEEWQVMRGVGSAESGVEQGEGKGAVAYTHNRMFECTTWMHAKGRTA